MTDKELRLGSFVIQMHYGGPAELLHEGDSSLR